MTTTLYIILASLISTLLGVGAASIILVSEKIAHRLTVALISFGVGTMLGAVFFDLLPEAIDLVPAQALPLTLAGILLFFVLEKTLVIYHCHEEEVHDHHRLRASRSLILFGDFIHNFLDGIIIATAFLSSTTLGVITSIAVVAHEIPQEIGDFSVLIHSGMKRGRALLWNLVSGLGSLAGAVALILLSTTITGLTNFLLPIAAGGFLYIAGADLIPELHREVRFRHSLAHLVALAAGLAAIILVGRLFPHT